MTAKVVALVVSSSLAGCSGSSTPSSPSAGAVTSIVGASFSGDYVTSSATRSGFVCRDNRRVTGTMTVTLTQQSPTVAGTAELSGTHSTTATTCPLGEVGDFPFRGSALAVSGPVDRVAFSQEVMNTRTAGAGEVIESTFTRAFTGALSNGVLTGTLTFSDRHVFASGTGEGSVAMPVTATLR